MDEPVVDGGGGGGGGLSEEVSSAAFSSSLDGVAPGLKPEEAAAPTAGTKATANNPPPSGRLPSSCLFVLR